MRMYWPPYSASSAGASRSAQRRAPDDAGSGGPAALAAGPPAPAADRRQLPHRPGRLRPRPQRLAGARASCAGTCAGLRPLHARARAVRGDPATADAHGTTVDGSISGGEEWTTAASIPDVAARRLPAMGCVRRAARCSSMSVASHVRRGSTFCHASRGHFMRLGLPHRFVIVGQGPMRDELEAQLPMPCSPGCSIGMAGRGLCVIGRVSLSQPDRYRRQRRPRGAGVRAASARHGCWWAAGEPGRRRERSRAPRHGFQRPGRPRWPGSSGGRRAVTIWRQRHAPMRSRAPGRTLLPPSSRPTGTSPRPRLRCPLLAPSLPDARRWADEARDGTVRRWPSEAHGRATRRRNAFIVAHLHPRRRVVNRPRYPAGAGCSAQATRRRSW